MVIVSFGSYLLVWWVLMAKAIAVSSASVTVGDPSKEAAARLSPFGPHTVMHRPKMGEEYEAASA